MLSLYRLQTPVGPFGLKRLIARRRYVRSDGSSADLLRASIGAIAFLPTLLAHHGMDSLHRSSNAAGQCPLPLLHRSYQAAVVGIAVFFAVLTVLREPFRGYQTEVRLRGTPTVAIEPAALRDWLQASDSKAAAAISGGAGGRPLEIRIGRIGPRLAAAQHALDDLGRGVLNEYLPQVHATARRQVVQSLQRDLRNAEQAEQALAARARDLADRRQALIQPAAAAPPAAAEVARGIEVPASQPTASPATSGQPDPLHQQLDMLRLELSRLLANFTEEHPQVVALRRQIDSLQQQLELQAPSANIERLRQGAERAAAYTSFPLDADAADAAPSAELAQVQEEAQRVAAQLTTATSARQSAEHKLHTTLASLSLESPTAGWSLEPARLVARLGGTPRMLPLLLASVLSVAAGLAMFRLATISASRRMLATTAELSRALPIPIVGHTPVMHKPRSSASRTWITPGRLLWATRAAELWLVALALTCTFAIYLDQSLAGQFPGDPLGVLSEIVGRIGGA